ncbi:tRNA pseudouridine(55) synthase TruB [Aquibacillus sp. 3ASR75-11]|uniref:tRNA pseudouridine synthase B n=1 Tax=Terrihalobacillus insolitus TaxID=2950438 RepID=A0A9X3WRJ1_9BACI|nr:tRNA pseudouridine(55) synthase TruB [Terrihalobacillus insolitus]MDC3414097.1 tRNA pseudouridine(55) synthase TruB [Terrihalobacillus insolitus]MDC3423538.1 tRNA pseudouridine(55) synthase TruB [Terrihalobacillus insolitus]
MNGILPLWKPKGMTSHDCVIKIRKLFGTKKVGHTGTLDPEVEGVLPICIGKATKIVPFLTDTTKTYQATIYLGATTETEDRHGIIVEKTPIDTVPSMETINHVFNQFKGEITQIPPMYSAVKINGKKLYEYAREGKTIERPTRAVNIHQIQLNPRSIKKEDDGVTFDFLVKCSKGTYIRTLCVDIGKALGYAAHMYDLTRISTGSFEAQHSYTFEQIEQAIKDGNTKHILAPVEKGVDHLDVYEVDQSTSVKILHGQKLEKPQQVLKTDKFRIQFQDQLLAIYQVNPKNAGEIKPVRVFNE